MKYALYFVIGLAIALPFTSLVGALSQLLDVAGLWALAAVVIFIAPEAVKVVNVAFRGEKDDVQVHL